MPRDGLGSGAASRRTDAFDSFPTSPALRRRPLALGFISPPHQSQKTRLGPHPRRADMLKAAIC